MPMQGAGPRTKIVPPPEGVTGRKRFRPSAAVEHSTRRVGEDVDGTLRPVSALSSTTQTKAMWIRLAAEV